MQRNTIKNEKTSEQLNNDQILPAEIWYGTYRSLPPSDWQNLSKVSQFLRSVGLTIYSDHGGNLSNYKKQPLLSSTRLEFAHNQSVSEIFLCNKTTIGVVISSNDIGRGYQENTAKILFYTIKQSLTLEENPYIFSHLIELTDEHFRFLKFKNVVKWSEELLACIGNGKILFWNWHTGERDKELENKLSHIKNVSHLAITRNKTLVCTTSYLDEVKQSAYFINLEKNQGRCISIPGLRLSLQDDIVTFEKGVIFETCFDKKQNLSLYDEEGNLLSQHSYPHSLKLACVLPDNQLASFSYPFIHIHDLITGVTVEKIDCSQKNKEANHPVFNYIGSNHIMTSVVDEDKEYLQLWNYKEKQFVQEIPMERKYNLKFPICFSMRARGLVILCRTDSELINFDFSPTKVALENSSSVDAIDSEKTAGYRY